MLEAQTLQERTRTCIGYRNEGLDPLQAQRIKAVRKHGVNCLKHIASALIRRAEIIADFRSMMLATPFVETTGSDWLEIGSADQEPAIVVAVGCRRIEIDNGKRLLRRGKRFFVIQILLYSGVKKVLDHKGGVRRTDWAQQEARAL